MNEEDENSRSSNSSTDELLQTLKEHYPGAVVQSISAKPSRPRPYVHPDHNYATDPTPSKSVIDENVEIQHDLENIILAYSMEEAFSDYNVEIQPAVANTFPNDSIHQLVDELGCHLDDSNLDYCTKEASSDYNVESHPAVANTFPNDLDYSTNEAFGGCNVDGETVSRVSVNTAQVEKVLNLYHGGSENDDPDDPDYIPDEDVRETRDSTLSYRPENEADDLKNTNAENSLGVIKRKRKRKPDPSEWRDMKNKKLRETGKSYEGWSRKKGEKAQRGTEREGRKMGPPCQSAACKKYGVRQCQEISEEERSLLFSTFWQDLSWDQKKIYVASLVKRDVTATTKSDKSRRGSTLMYTIKTPKGRILRVCKQLFLSTFGLGEWTVAQWASKNIDGESHGMSPSTEVCTSRKRTRGSTKGRKNEDGVAALQSFLDAMPKLPSHYCRKKSNKVYFEPIYGNRIADVFKEYQKVCLENENGPIKPASRATFDKYIMDMNLSFQPPKKDRCDKCIKYESGNLDEDSYHKHINKKERSRNEKNADVKKAEEGLCVVLTQDVQAVKVCPSLNASALYYKTKLCCHNFTVYDVRNKSAKCYWFDETQGDLTANTFASCMINYLQENWDGTKPIIIWSDGCTSQNRNSIVSNALLCFSNQNNIEVTQKFLVKGHTQMEVDSIHSLIERRLKDKPIHLPSDLIRYTKEARVKPCPIDTKMLQYDFAKDYAQKDLMAYDSIRPGRKPGDPKVTNIRAIHYSPGGKIQIQLDFDKPKTDIPQRMKRQFPQLSDFSSVHQAPLKITKKKWKHLQELKSVIPPDCHSFYDLLPYNESC